MSAPVQDSGLVPEFFYFLINLTGSSISSGNSDAGLPVATSVIQVAYTMHEVFSILGVDRIFWRAGMKPGAAVLAGRYGKTLDCSRLPPHKVLF